MDHLRFCHMAYITALPHCCKQCKGTCLVLRWGTTGEAHVLYSPQTILFQCESFDLGLYLGTRQFSTPSTPCLTAPDNTTVCCRCPHTYVTRQPRQRIGGPRRLGCHPAGHRFGSETPSHALQIEDGRSGRTRSCWPQEEPWHLSGDRRRAV